MWERKETNVKYYKDSIREFKSCGDYGEYETYSKYLYLLLDKETESEKEARLSREKQEFRENRLAQLLD